jgi:flagellar hook-length control protein FliK
LNSPSPQLQMPSHVDAKPAASPGTAGTGDSAAQGSDSGFAKALRMLQVLAQDGVQISAGQAGKDQKTSLTDSTRKQSSDGKDLPLTALLLPLLQPIQAAAPAHAGTGDAAKSATDAAGGEWAKTSLAQLRDMMQLLSGQKGSSSDAGELKAWLTVLTQAAGGKAGEPSVVSTNASITAALTAHAGAGGAGTVGNTQTQQQAASAQAPLTLADPGFANALGERVSWMTGSAGNHAAQLQLHPRELGPMLVHVKVDGHHTEVLFQTQHAAVRDALEAALPRLREMLGQGGQQVSVNVQQQAGGWSGQSGQGQQQMSQQWTSQAAWSGFTPIDGVEPSSELSSPLVRWYGLPNGMIDTYV